MIEIDRNDQLIFLCYKSIQRNHPLITQQNTGTQSSMNADQDKQLTLNDEFLTFNHSLNLAGHNVKKYIDRKEELSKKLEKPVPKTTQTSHDYIRTLTIDHTERPTEYVSQERMNINLKKMQNRRASLTAGNSHRKLYDHLKTQCKTTYLNKTFHTRCPNNQSTDHQKLAQPKWPKQNKFTILQKKHNKGPVKEKYLETWLNSILIEACASESFDMSTQNPALKKYALDRNSLLSKGVESGSLNRIYRSLFVYSLGFNDLLDELCSSNMSLRKTIWKVYAILLEYCAKGHFQSMIAGIERDKLNKVQILRTEIENRQKIIDNNEQMNEQKNAKIIKQIKNLKLQNHNLQQDNMNLLQQYKQAEQAFNQEVSLRLKFENRINEIHGVYCELENKHSRLRHSLSQKNQELEAAKCRENKQNAQLIDFRAENQIQRAQILSLKKQLQKLQEINCVVQADKDSCFKKGISLNNEAIELKHIINEKNRNIEQLKSIITKNEVIFLKEQEKLKQVKSQFETSLVENRNLHKTIKQHMTEINDLMIKQHNFEQSHRDYIAKAAMAQKRLEEFIQKYIIVQQDNQQLTIKTGELQSLLCGQNEFNRQLEIDLNQCYMKIKDMDGVKNRIEEQLETIKIRMSAFDEILLQKNEQNQELRNYNEELSLKNTDLTTENATLLSRMSSLKEKLKNESDLANRRYNQLKKQKETIENQLLNFDSIKKIIQLQKQKYQHQLEQLHAKYKQQKFEYVNLNERHLLALESIKQENKHIDEQQIQMSELRVIIEQQQIKVKKSEFIQEQIQKQYERDRRYWESKISDLQAHHHHSRQNINPMIYEDVIGNYFNLREKYENLCKDSEFKLTQLQNKLDRLNTDSTLKQQELSMKLSSLQADRKAVIDRKNLQLDYEQQRNQHLSEKVKKLDQQLSLYIDSGSNRFVNPQQQNYIRIINQRNKENAELLKQLQQMQDANTQLRRQCSSLEKDLRRKNEEIEELKGKIEEIQKVAEQYQEEKVKVEEKYEQAARESVELKKTRQLSSGKKSRHSNNAEQEHSSSKAVHQRDFARKFKGAYMYYHK